MKPRALGLAFLLPTVFAGPAHGTQAAMHNDLNGDGRSDLLWRNTQTGSLVVWPSANFDRAGRILVNDPKNFDLSRVTLEGTGNIVDASARSMLVVQDTVGNGFYLLGFNYALGWGYRAASLDVVPVGPGWTLAGIGDFDGDGVGDLLMRNEADGRNAVTWSSLYWEVREIAAVTNLSWQVIGVGDFDGDQLDDILWRNRNTGRDAIWRSANASTQQPMGTVLDTRWKIAAIGDFDGDGRDDVFWRHDVRGANVIWYAAHANDVHAVTAVTNPAWKVDASGDFDGDGRDDLFWRNRDTGANVLWLAADPAGSLALTAVRNPVWTAFP